MAICRSFYIFFLSYNTLQNKVHNLLLDEAWEGGRLWLESVVFFLLGITKQWADRCFSGELVVLRLQSLADIFGPSLQLGL